LTLTAVYPRIGELYRKTIHEAKLNTIQSKDYKSRKDRLLEVVSLFDQRKDLDHTKRRELVQLILVKDDFQGAQRLLDGSSQENSQQTKSKSKSWTQTFRSFSEVLSLTSKPSRQTRSMAVLTSDPESLLRLNDISGDDETLQKAVADTINFAHNYLNATISKSLKKLVHGALHIQQEDCKKRVQQEAASLSEMDMDCLQKEFIRKIEMLSQSESNLYAYLTFIGVFSFNV
jgi:hypothetical protein